MASVLIVEVLRLVDVLVSVGGKRTRIVMVQWTAAQSESASTVTW